MVKHETSCFTKLTPTTYVHVHVCDGNTSVSCTLQHFIHVFFSLLAPLHEDGAAAFGRFPFRADRLSNSLGRRWIVRIAARREMYVCVVVVAARVHVSTWARCAVLLVRSGYACAPGKSTQTKCSRLGELWRMLPGVYY